MEHTLRCNAMKCRKELNELAVVTTCSHIFCLECTEALRQSDPLNGQRPACPACETRWLKPDDAFVTNLRPTEDYKTSILSGLSPTIIMECAGRALSFWAYQATQEVVYQGMIVTSLSDKFTSLNTQMDNIIHDANAEISDLRVKMNGLLVDRENLRQELGVKGRKHTETQTLYDSHKQRAMLDHAKNAASDAIDHRIQASAAGHHFLNQTPNLGRPRQLPRFTDTQGNKGQLSSHRIEGFVVPSIPPPIAGAGTREVWNPQRIHENNGQLDEGQTPSSHRQRLTGVELSSIGLASLQTGRKTSAPLSQRRATPSRAALTNLSPHGIGNGSYPFASYGMSAAIKVSHPPAALQGINGRTRSTVRSRVAQRPGSAALMESYPTFRQASGQNNFGQGNGYH